MRRLVIAGCVISMACAAFWLWMHVPATAARSAPDTTTAVAARPRVVRGIGYVEPVSELRRLAFKVDGVIDACKVHVGQRVKQGEILFTLKNHDKAAALATARCEYQLAEKERDQIISGVNPFRILAAERRVDFLREQAEQAERHWKRTQELFDKNASTQAMRDLAQSELLQANASLKQAEAEAEHLRCFVRTTDKEVAEAKLQLALARMEEAQQQLNDTLLTAPFDGTVLEVLRREGERARASDTDAVLLFADDSLLRVRAEIDERYVRLLSEGQTAVVSGRPLSGHSFAGQVAVVKRVMGKKTIFTHDASERKDLDVVQVLIDMQTDFSAPLALQVDVDISVPAGVQP